MNAADALLVSAPLLLLLLRDASACGAPSLQWGFAGVALTLSLALSHADALQGNVYRRAAADLDAQIGAAPGQRWQVGQWGFQHYAAQRGFRALLPDTPNGQGSPLAVGDWLATARNVSQLDVAASMRRYDVQPLRSSRRERVAAAHTNPDPEPLLFPPRWLRALRLEHGAARHDRARPRDVRTDASGSIRPVIREGAFPGNGERIRLGCRRLGGRRRRSQRGVDRRAGRTASRAPHPPQRPTASPVPCLGDP